MKTCVFVLCILLILNKDVSGDAIVDSFMAVFVMYDGNQCDGTVIHSHFIITVSECFLDDDGQITSDDFQVVTFKKLLHRKDVSEIFLHHNYVPKFFGFNFNLVLVKFKLPFTHINPIKLHTSDYHLKNNIATITEQYIKLKWADECQKEYNMCTQTYERNERVKSALGVGLIYQDSESNTKLMIGILAEFDGFVQRYKRISEITDWIEAHTSDDTLTVQNYCQKSDDTDETEIIMKPRIHTQGQFFKFDWQVRIFNNITNIECSGSLIRSYVILTAESCVMNLEGTVNKNLYNVKFNNKHWLADIVQHVELCIECVDFDKRLMENDIAMMVVTEQKDAPLIAPIKLSDSKGQCDLMKESFAHFALHPAIINDFENGQSIFNARRFISNWDCAEIYRSVIGRICTKSRQEFDLSPHDVGSGLVYCNEKTGVPQLYAVLIDYDKATKTQIYAYLDYYQDWIHN